MTLEGKPAARKPIRLVYLLPLGFFAALALIFLTRLESGTDPSAIPSVLVGKPAPAFALPALDGAGVPAVTNADFAGAVTLVNIFASWCGPCRQEHPLLTELAKDGRIRVVGINYKDQPANAVRFLQELGNPYAAIGVDERGRAAIDWGVYGVPETFLVDKSGIIRAKIIGQLKPENIAETLQPAMEAALRPPQ